MAHGRDVGVRGHECACVIGLRQPVCMYVCMYVVFMYVCTCTGDDGACEDHGRHACHTCTQTYTHTSTHKHSLVCVCVFVCTCGSVCTS
jgi:hypothetical protein